MKIKKAIIPAAGLGTRFLPATKAQPKEMLPIVDKPTIQYIVEEAVESGIEDIIIVTGRGKRAIEDHFDKSYELEETLSKRNKWDILETVQKVSNMANIHYIRQKEPLGLGHAIYCARKFIGEEAFAVLLGDDIILNSDYPCLKQLIDINEDHNCSVIAIQEVDKEDVDKYGIVDIRPENQDNVFKVESIVEKPSQLHAPSNFGVVGRYILTPKVFEILARQTAGIGGEIQLTDSIQELIGYERVLALQYAGVRYDVGDKLGFIKATLDFAIEREELREEMIHYLEYVVENHRK